MSNQVHFYSRIDEKTANRFIEDFERALSSQCKNVEIHISSPGGQIDASEKICNMIQLSYKPVDIYIHKKKYSGVASAASVVTQFCRKKVIDKDATFLIHHARNGSEIIQNEEDIFFWMEHTGRDYQTIQNLLVDEPELSSETALNLGFVNEISNKEITLECVNCGKRYKNEKWFIKHIDMCHLI